MKVLMEKAKIEDLNWQNAHGASVLFVAAQQVRSFLVYVFTISGDINFTLDRAMYH